MSGAKVEKYVTLVMDGSDVKVLSNIINVIDALAGTRNGETVYSPLDSNHPTLMILETFTNSRIYKTIEKVIESMYPGLCVFNPVTTV